MFRVRVRVGVLAVLLSAPAIVLPASAQEAVNYGSISGRVTDPAGAALREAQVRARQTQTNVLAEAHTDQDGRFRFSYLRVGPYEVVVHVDGFADTTRLVTVTWIRLRDLPVTLKVAGVETSVTVTANRRSSRRPAPNGHGGEPVQALPMNGATF
jgi:hypothetical protein